MTDRNKRVTLKDIALNAGTSANTVSLALRDSPLLADDTKKRIQQIARNMKYVNNALAGSLRSGCSHTIAIILGDITVGDNAKVAAGSVVVHDVPHDVTVAGVPAKVVRDRRFKGPRLVEDDFDPSKLDDENIRWSCAL